MLKDTLTYTDYDGKEITEDFYFGLRQSDLVMLNSSVEGGFEQKIKNIINAQDGNALMREMRNIILLAYGEKSADGKHFKKSEEISNAFEDTLAYDKIFMRLVTNADEAQAFIKAILPEDLAQQIEEKMASEV